MSPRDYFVGRSVERRRTPERIAADRHRAGQDPLIDDRPLTATASVDDELARERFGGLDIGAALVGMLTGLAMLLLLGTAIGALAGTTVEYDTVAASLEATAIVAAVLSLLTLFVAFLVGGWAAGRIARFDGPRNGVLAGMLALLLAAAFGLLALRFGDRYDLVAAFELPNVFSAETLTAAGVLGALASVVAIAGGGALGGWLGERYHRRVDEHLVA